MGAQPWRSDPYDPRNFDIPEHEWSVGVRHQAGRPEVEALLKRLNMRTLVDFASRALSSGTGEVKPRSVHWDVSAGCHLPREVETWIQPVGRVTLTVACRTSCERCLWRRKMFWAHRAKAEHQAAQRTWFVTLTLGPRQRGVAERIAMRKAMQAGVDWNSAYGYVSRDGHQDRILTATGFMFLHRAIGPEVTKWLKRVRKVSGARLRYLLVVEAHEDGFPHYHLLVHEVNGSAPVTERQLRGTWRGGRITQAKLVDLDDPRAAFYVCKYLSKSALARVRASGRYGLGVPTSLDGGLFQTDRRSRTKSIAKAAKRGVSSDPQAAPARPGGLNNGELV